MKAAFLLHGYATTTDDFKSIMPFLNKNYDAVFSDNLPGHGENSSPDAFTVSNVFQCVNDNYDKVAKEYDSIDVYGFSMGGALASYLASNKKVNKLILLAPANAYLNVRMLFSKVKKEMEYYFALTNDEDAFIKKELYKINSRRSRDMMLRQLLPNYSLSTMITFARIIRKCNDGLKENDTKTLIVWGELDQLVPKKSIEIIQEYFHNSQLVVMPELSHLMLYSRNYRSIIKEVEKFVEE